MSNHWSKLAPRQLYQELKRNHREYRDLFRGAETLAACYHRHFADGETAEFFRPKVGFIVLSEDTGISPGLIFNQPERELFILHTDPGQLTRRGTIDRIEHAILSNRLRLLVLMASIVRSRRRKLGLAAALLRRLSGGELVFIRNALLTAYQAKQTIERQSEAIRRAVADRSVAIVEALYDPDSRQVHLDVGGTMDQED